MTDLERLEAIADRCLKASSGPWEVEPDTGAILDTKGFCVGHIQFHSNVNTITRTGEQFSKADGDFISGARMDIPWLLDYVSRLREMVLDLEARK